jgi:acetone carboxylase gamma subunit
VALGQVSFVASSSPFPQETLVPSTLHIYSFVVQGMDHRRVRSRSSIEKQFCPTKKNKKIKIIICLWNCNEIIPLAFPRTRFFAACDISGVGFTPVCLSLIFYRLFLHPF